MQSRSWVAASSQLRTWALPWPRTLLVAGSEFPASSPLGLHWETCVRVQLGAGVCWEKHWCSCGCWCSAGGLRAPSPAFHSTVYTKLLAAASLPGRSPARMDGVSQSPGVERNHVLHLSKAMGAEGKAAPCLPAGTAKRREGEGKLQSWGWSVSTLNLGVLGVCGSEKSCFASPGGFGGGESW